MRAWVIEKISDLTNESKPLKLIDLPIPEPADGQILIKINACGVCHTEIDEIEGRTPPPLYPVIPGHQAVGTVLESKAQQYEINTGDRVGVAWIWSSCGHCDYCLSDQENLCNDYMATGRDANGGYAEYLVVPEQFAYPIPKAFSDAEAAPLLCAGAIGYRSLELCETSDGSYIGLSGFGASAHLVLKLIKHIYPNSRTYVFARSDAEREFALELGAIWAGDTTDHSPVLLDCVIDTTPAWKPVVHALENLQPGGRLVINAIRKEDHDKDYLQNLDYPNHLWMEKEIKSVANVTSSDVKEFIGIAAEMDFRPDVETYPFEKANQAILDIKNRKIKGAKVLVL